MLRTTLRRLEVFVAAVEAGGFRACADRLEISQAAVSHHVKQLEDELGYVLFLRRRGAVAGLTEQGVGAYRQARDLLEEAHRLEILKTGAPGLRRLSVQSDPVLDALLAKRITEYVGREAALSVSLRQSCFEEMVESFNSGEVDIVYFYSHGPVAEIESSLCWSEPVSICARQDHPVHEEAPSDLQALGRYPFVAPPRGSHFRRSVDRMLGRLGLAGYPIALEVDNASMAREAVINGLAISAVISRYLDEELFRFGVREVPLRDVSLSLQVRRAVRRELALDQDAARLTDYLDRGRVPSYAPAARPHVEHVSLAG
jgi:DNA-binding transcriptional LysR family regulator